MRFAKTVLSPALFSTAFIGLFSLTNNSIHSFPLLSFTTEIAETAPRVEQSYDSSAVFAATVDGAVTRLLSYSDSLDLWLAEAAATPETEMVEDHDHEHAAHVVDPAAAHSLQSLSVLSLGLTNDNVLTAYSNLFQTEVERMERGLRIRSLPMTVPVDGTVTSGFGMRKHPILSGRRMHKGLDMAAPTGTPIFVSGGGTVVFSGRKNGYGNTIIVDHGYGYTTLYAHCSKLLVAEGATVERGDTIALVGSTGRSTGPHLHYEVRLNDQHMNPEAFLLFEREATEDLSLLADTFLTF